MTHIIMSGPIKPLTEAERHFAKLKLRKIRAGEEEPQAVERPLLSERGRRIRLGLYSAQVVIDGRDFVTRRRASELLGMAKNSMSTQANRGCWETRSHPEEPIIVVFALADVLKTKEQKQKEKS